MHDTEEKLRDNGEKKSVVAQDYAVDRGALNVITDYYIRK